MIEQIKDDLKELFIKDSDTFFEKLKQYVAGNAEKKNLLFQKKNDLHKLEVKLSNGHLGNEEYRVEYRKLEMSLYKFVDNLSLAAFHHASPQQKEGEDILRCLKKIHVQYEGEEYRQVSSKVKTYLIHSEYEFTEGLKWFWNVKLMTEGTQFDYVSAKDNSAIKVRNTLGALLATKLKVKNKAALIAPVQIAFYAEIFLERLVHQPVNLVIDDALGLIKAPLYDDEVDFINEIWNPVGTIIEKANPKHPITLFLIQNEENPRSDKHKFTKSFKPDTSYTIPYAIKYHGLQHQNSNRQQLADQENLLEWIDEVLRSNQGAHIAVKPINGEIFRNFFINNKTKFYSICQCGNIEKLFKEICNTLNYQFVTHSPDTSTKLWEVKPKKITAAEEDTLANY